MPIHVIHFEHQGRALWGVVRNKRITPIPGDFASTAAFVRGVDLAALAALGGATLDEREVTLLSPVTRNQQFICQGANYRQHMIESGVDPDAKRFNMFFEKADASIQAPVGAIVRPAHVRLLDYEIELALVMKKPITGPGTVTADALHEYVFGITIANDVSARDVQLPQTQFFKGKSYRGFCPLGPYIALVDPSDMHYLDELVLTLEVNGNVRQRDTTHNLVYKPAETISELSTFSDVSPGDVLLTGTPAGCALRAPKRFLRNLMQLVLPEPRLWDTFVRMQSKRAEYLKPGDVVRATIASEDHEIDLGAQSHTVEEAP